jgi:hypothetical protein
MPEPRRGTTARASRGKPAPNSPHLSSMPTGRSAGGNGPFDSPRSDRPAGPARVVRTCQLQDVLAGLPADVMDELVADLAEAVVATLLSQAAIDADEEDDASGDLREIQ